MTSRSMAFTGAISSCRRSIRRVGKIACLCRFRVGSIRAFTPVFAGYGRARFCPRGKTGNARLCPPYGTSSFHRIRLLQLREIALLLELVDDAEIEIVIHVAAADIGPEHLDVPQPPLA